MGKNDKIESKELFTSNSNDKLATVLKSLFGNIPFASSYSAHLINELIPNQRIDRIAKFLAQLELDFRKLKKTILSKKFQSEESIALIEESILVASKTRTKERISYICSIVINGISNDEIDKNSSIHILGILSELNDIEILWLRWYIDNSSFGDKEFREKHAKVFEEYPSYYAAKTEDKNKNALQESYKKHLERLYLLRPNYKVDMTTREPKFDISSGAPKIKGYDVTQFGVLLLHEIGLLPKDSNTTESKELL